MNNYSLSQEEDCILVYNQEEKVYYLFCFYYLKDQNNKFSLNNKNEVEISKSYIYYLPNDFETKNLESLEYVSFNSLSHAFNSDYRLYIDINNIDLDQILKLCENAYFQETIKLLSNINDIKKCIDIAKSKKNEDPQLHRYIIMNTNEQGLLNLDFENRKNVND